MSNRVPQGKGSKDRTHDRKIYDANFDGIRWSSQTKPAAKLSAEKRPLAVSLSQARPVPAVNGRPQV